MNETAAGDVIRSPKSIGSLRVRPFHLQFK
jgi:hypothetical protein